ncbi:hypothetical protein MINT15_39660 [Saccharomonospora viridis]|nr:hypothetical protein MINT15_39660 [Saccharomonospora viridis]
MAGLSATAERARCSILSPMAMPELDDHPADPTAFAADQATLFAGHNLHVGSSRIAHAVDWVPWINGLRLPAPACRQGFAGHGAHGELRPTTLPVSCRRCRRLRGLRNIDDQPALFVLPQ